jgi:hypothetical protein
VPTIVGLCAVYLALALGMLLKPALRRMDSAETMASS